MKLPCRGASGPSKGGASLLNAQLQTSKGPPSVELGQMMLNSIGYCSTFAEEKLVVVAQAKQPPKPTTGGASQQPKSGTPTNDSMRPNDVGTT